MYELTWNGKQLIRRIYGRSSSTEYAESVVEAQSDPRHDSVRDVIADLRDCTSYEPVARSGEEIAIRDAGAALSNRGIRVAMIVPDNEVGQKIREAIRVYQSVNVIQRPMTVVDSMEAALAWLRANPPAQ